MNEKKEGSKEGRWNVKSKEQNEKVNLSASEAHTLDVYRLRCISYMSFYRKSSG